MVGVGGGIVIGLVATDTGIGCVVVIATDMAIGAVGHIGMRPVEWPHRVVIKRSRYPAVFIVTLGAIR